MTSCTHLLRESQTAAEKIMCRAYWRRWRSDRKVEAAYEAAAACGVSYERIRWALMNNPTHAIQLPESESELARIRRLAQP